MMLQNLHIFKFFCSISIKNSVRNSLQQIKKQNKISLHIFLCYEFILLICISLMYLKVKYVQKSTLFPIHYLLSIPAGYVQTIFLQ